MLRLLQASLSTSTLASSRVCHSSTNRIGRHQAFFWSANNSDDDDDPVNNGKKGEADNIKVAATSATEASDDGTIGKRISPSKNQMRSKGQQRHDHLWALSSSSSSAGNQIYSPPFLPSLQGFGDNAPRFPHLIGLPIIHKPLFPGLPLNVTISDKATIDALENLTSKGPAYVGVFLRKSGSDGILDDGSLEVIEKPEVITDSSQIYSVGTFAQIHRFQREEGIDPSSLHAFGNVHQEEDQDHREDDSSSSSAASLFLLAHRCIDLMSIDNYGPPLDITVKHWDKAETPKGDAAKEDMIKALTNEVISSIREIAAMSPMFREQISRFPIRVDTSNPHFLANFAASISMGSPAEHQAVLEERDAEKKLHKALLLLSKEREVSKLQQMISRKVEEKMTDQQRRYLLTEQLKSIKKELGMEMDDKEALIEKYKKKFDRNSVSEEVAKVIDSELEKLSTLEKNSSEFNVTRSYLDWLTDIPWGVTSDESFDIVKAREILDRDHYGLDQVKDTIIQFIAVGKLKGSVSQGNIIILFGPPGVGKTSVAKSIAEALGRKFFRFSVGGLGDVSEIKGHRRTYVGAMPGKFIQGLKSAGTCNPLILIDEIDKLGRDFRGDPASALLEVLASLLISLIIHPSPHSLSPILTVFVHAYFLPCLIVRILARTPLFVITFLMFLLT